MSNETERCGDCGRSHDPDIRCPNFHAGMMPSSPCEASRPTLDHGEDDGLVEFLREEAAHYDRTIYKHTRDKFERAAARIEQDRETIRELREALEVFASCPTKGKHGGRFVIAKAIYDDGDVSPREAHWHMSEFDKARAALTRKD